MPTRSARLLTAAAFWLVAVVCFAGGAFSALRRVEFGDTSTSVVNGLHQYLGRRSATPLRVALAVTIILLVVSALCTLLAAVVMHGMGPAVYRRAVIASVVLVATIASLWFIPGPDVSPKRIHIAPVQTVPRTTNPPGFTVPTTA